MVRCYFPLAIPTEEVSHRRQARLYRSATVRVEPSRSDDVAFLLSQRMPAVPMTSTPPKEAQMLGPSLLPVVLLDKP